jgi:hypothetical protein
MGRGESRAFFVGSRWMKAKGCWLLKERRGNAY